jgi:hypothetical protein
MMDNEEWFGKEFILNEEVVLKDPEEQKEMDKDPYLQAYKNALKKVYGEKDKGE